LSWNIGGSKYYTQTSFKKVAPILENSQADIFCLQEAQDIPEELAILPNLKKLNPVFPNDQSNRNIILSRLPIMSSGELDFPEKITPNLEKVTWANIQLENKILKIYNCHLEITGIGPQQRIEQLQIILQDATNHSGPVIICGDMNTTLPRSGWKRKIISLFHAEKSNSFVSYQDERYEFLKTAEAIGFLEAIDIKKTTWSIMPLKWEFGSLKLDWFLIRDLKSPQITLGNYISDHRSVLAKFSNN
jgi:endonuclease/exonuclease/phosphatase family metal-dependent hydrolase